MKDIVDLTNPRIRIMSSLMGWLFLVFIPLNSFSQSGTITGSGTVQYNADGTVKVSGSKTFTSHISGVKENIDNMLQLDLISLYYEGTDLSGGIKANVETSGSITLSVFSCTNTSPPQKGALLYKKVLTSSSPTAYGGSPVSIPYPGGAGTIMSNQIKKLVNIGDAWLVNKSRSPNPLNLFTATMAYLHKEVNPLLETQLNNYLKGNNYKPLQPVIVQLSVKDATILRDGIKVPGMAQYFDLNNYFNDSKSLTVKVKINGIVKQTYKAGNLNPPPINCKMGDLITFDVTYNGNGAPKIEGVPGAWIARFAGDLMYYCTPSVTPGEFNPWIGYDSRVHNLQLRRYDGDPAFQMKVSDWNHPAGNSYSWSWTLQRRMDANKIKYQPSHVWIKYKTLKSGAKQRNNQREGLNVQFLEYWQGGQTSDFRSYQGNANYMMGFDDDELFYLNSQYHDAIHHPPLVGIAKLDSIPSRGMPEGYDQLYDELTGYPVQGFPLNNIISAYKKNREWKLNHNGNYNVKYDGYEIQDLGTDEKHPDGAGAGNNKAPGTIYIRAGGQVVTIKTNVTAPVTNDLGFYGLLEGNRWPAYFEKKMPFTLSGLKGLSTDELNKFSMAYQGSDALGNLSSQVKLLKDLSTSEKTTISSTGKWITTFDNILPTYSAVTVYYQQSPTSKKVMIAGKELKSLFLLFLGEKNLEGKGLGAKIWLNDFRLTPTSEYTVRRKFGNTDKYMKPDVRTYTFPVGTTTTFEAWDGDPHLTYDPGIEWFLSSRTLAKRIPENYLDGTAPGVVSPYLKYYINGSEQTTGRSGKDWTYTWNTPGTYTLKVVYRIEGGLTSYQHKINIIDYPSIPPTKGRIAWRHLTPKEKSFLKISVSDTAEVRMFEITDVYSQYMYKDGPRANTPYVNRWADYNDYASQYEWNRSCSVYQTTFIDNYNNRDWFWYYWALHYSSNWRDKLPAGLPPYVADNQVTRVRTTELDVFSTQIAKLFRPLTQGKWQYTVPLVSYTDYQGDRMRTNPSCLYDLKYLWNNENGAFSGNPVLPTDPTKIQAPDITDDQKDKMELYYDLKSGKKIVLSVTSTPSIYVSVRNVYGQIDQFIADARYQPMDHRSLFTSVETGMIQDSLIIYPNPVINGGRLNVRILAQRGGTANAYLMTTTGQRVGSWKWNYSIGGENYACNLSRLFTGEYILVVQLSDRTVSRKIMIK